MDETKFLKHSSCQTNNTRGHVGFCSGAAVQPPFHMNLLNWTVSHYTPQWAGMEVVSSAMRYITLLHRQYPLPSNEGHEYLELNQTLDF